MKKILFLLLFFVATSHAQDNSTTYFYNQINLKKHAGKKFIFSGKIKTVLLSKNSSAFLFIRINNGDDKSLLVKTMYAQHANNNQWKEYSIEGEIDPQAAYVYIAGSVEKKGLFYFDDFVFKVKEQDESWTVLSIKNADFEKNIINNDVPFWEKAKDDLKYQYKSSSDVSTKSKGKQSLLIESVYVENEEVATVNSSKLNPKNEVILISNINVIDVKTGKEKVRSVLIRDQKIAEISKKIKIEDSTAITIDGTGKWLLPGLIDSHVHLFQSGSLYTRPDAIDLTNFRPYEEERKWLRIHAPDLLKRYLKSGITTIIDVGGPFYNYTIRDRYSDRTSFPNIYLTGPLISTYQPKAFNIDDSPIIKVNSPEEAINLVKKQLPFKPDFIKIWYIKRGDATLNYEIVKATINESHKHNLKVAVHATDLESAKRAIRAGADILVHSVGEAIDEEFIEMISSNNVSYIPTLMVGDKYTEAFAQEIEFSNRELRLSNPFPIKSFSDHKHLDNDEQFNRYKKSSIAYKKNQLEEDKIEAENLKLLQKKNINIATGTDAGNIGTLHATSYQEEIELMKNAGLSNLEIIQASTINAAKVLSKENEIGSIENGKLADLLILENNPLENIKALQGISHVIKGGSIYPIENVLKESPENIVQRQVNAYNLQNVEAFLENYSDAIEIYEFPNTLTIKGKKDFSEGWKEFFEKNPDLHCEIINRTVIGNTVIDHERVKYDEGNYNEAVAIYTIENEKITKVYFVRK